MLSFTFAENIYLAIKSIYNCITEINIKKCANKASYKIKNIHKVLKILNIDKVFKLKYIEKNQDP